MGKIAIVGAGMMGSAMVFPAADNGHDVHLVGTPLDEEIIRSVQESGYHPTLKRTLPAQVHAHTTDELAAALSDVDLVIGGVSSFGIGWFERGVLPQIAPGTPVLFVTKGLEMQAGGALLPFPLALARRLPAGLDLPLCAVGGPCISFELADRHNTGVFFCGAAPTRLAALREMLATSYYHIAVTDDVCGIETAVALKNAYALGVSLAIGLAQRAGGEAAAEQYNPQAALFAQSCREAARLIELTGGKPASLGCFAGDLYVTVFGGRTRRIGTLLGRGLSFAQARRQLEGVTLESVAIASLCMEALRQLEALGAARTADFPLLAHIDELINRQKLVSVPWQAFCEDYFV